MPQEKYPLLKFELSPADEEKAVRTRTPIRQPLPRQPGQSLVEQRRRLFDERFDPLVTFTLCVIIWAGTAWHFWWQARPPTLMFVGLVSFIALFSVGYTLHRGFGVTRESRRFTLGIEGERVVAASLDQLRQTGYEVLHDLLGEGWNIDHVVVGPAGIFTVETKALRKPEKGPCVIQYNRTTIYANGATGYRNRDAWRQAKAQAHWLRKELRQLMGEDHFIQPAILFPGWFIEQRQGPPFQQPVWILNPDMFISHLLHHPRKLSTEQIRQLSCSLGRQFGEKPSA